MNDNILIKNNNAILIIDDIDDTFSSNIINTFAKTLNRYDHEKNEKSIKMAWKDEINNNIDNNNVLNIKDNKFKFNNKPLLNKKNENNLDEFINEISNLPINITDDLHLNNDNMGTTHMNNNTFNIEKDNNETKNYLNLDSIITRDFTLNTYTNNNDTILTSSSSDFNIRDTNY